MLGTSVASTEPHASWLSFLQGLRGRGVTGVELAVPDAHEGLKRAILEAFQGAAWQRCTVHLMRDCIRAAGSRPLARIVAPVPGAKNADAVRAMYHVAADILEGCCPKAAAVWEDAETDALACPGLPTSHWKRFRTDNLQERTNRETKRRSRVVQVLPPAESLERLVGAVMCEQDDIWADSRHFSERKVSEPCEEHAAPKQEMQRLDAMARKATGASLELADSMEAA